MREVTQHLGWDKPKETQAAIWSAIKARFESVGPEIFEMKRRRMAISSAKLPRAALKRAHSKTPPLSFAIATEL